MSVNVSKVYQRLLDNGWILLKSEYDFRILAAKFIRFNKSKSRLLNLSIYKKNLQPRK